MRTNLYKIQAAGIALALAFTFSCDLGGSGGGDDTAMCGGKEYSTTEFSCKGGELVGKCRGVDYYPDFQVCNNGKIEDIDDNTPGSSSAKAGSSSSGNAFAGDKGTFTDSRDKQAYKWVKIGEQTWMAQNLNYAEEWVGPTRGNKCYNSKDENCEKYGRLYEWDDAIRLCPDGWHLPTEAEWNALKSFVGTDPGKKLKSASSDWGTAAGTDAYGFAALPSGALQGKEGSKEFKNINTGGYWWTATEYDPARSLSTVNFMEAGNGVGTYTSGNATDWALKTNQFSIRCVKGVSSSSSIAYGKVTDARDKKEYKTVKIGDQRWMAENLNFAGDDEIGSCYNNKAANCDKYGRLYTWAAAMDAAEEYNTKKLNAPPGQHQGICPDSWHLPTVSEWDALANYVGADAGKKLKARNSEWGDNYGTDIYGFGALPGGALQGKEGSKEFKNINTGGYWWTATEYNTDNNADRIRSSINFMGDVNYVGTFRSGNANDWALKTNQFSIRCVED